MIGGYHPWFAEELARRVDAECCRRAVDLGDGGIATLEEYRYQCGVIAGLRLALEITDNIKKDIDRG